MIKSNKYGLVVRLDGEMPFAELTEAVARKFKEAANFFQDAKMAVTFQGRVLTKDQEDRLVNAIVMNSRIHVICIVDERPEEAEYYEHAIRLAGEAEARQGQFYRGNLRGGQTMESETSIVILGDVNPGASVVSKGNVVVLGSCRGNVYAGASGNHDCFIAALVMKPVQIRIADKMARSAIAKRSDNAEYALDPKIAYIKDNHIHVKNLVRSTLEDMLGTADAPEEKKQKDG
ncbi:septum site-determining protein MinC [Marvinbryantia formatexigens]|nr:septum site-determining protein MinC [Marvinbryantia formatexigens]UWO24591.1 septum site-determining protein MinC [Marvinbryantia formatexigens DSM 14469]